MATPLTRGAPMDRPTTLGRVVPKDRYSTSTPIAIGTQHGRDKLSLPYAHGVCHRPSRTSPPLSGVFSAVTVKDPLNSAFLGATCTVTAHGAPHTSFGMYL
jgi:hypothetical protein